MKFEGTTYHQCTIENGAYSIFERKTEPMIKY